MMHARRVALRCVVVWLLEREREREPVNEKNHGDGKRFGRRRKKRRSIAVVERIDNNNSNKFTTRINKKVMKRARARARETRRATKTQCQRMHAENDR
jgi:hypothetical protein